MSVVQTIIIEGSCVDLYGINLGKRNKKLVSVVKVTIKLITGVERLSSELVVKVYHTLYKVRPVHACVCNITVIYIKHNGYI